jgi:hypothetical protein
LLLIDINFIRKLRKCCDILHLSNHLSCKTFEPTRELRTSSRLLVYLRFPWASRHFSCHSSCH